MADKMLIDGLIKFCDEKSKNIKLKAEPRVFIEIKQALEELKAIKQWKSDVMEGFCKYDASSFEEIVVNARAKAIDKFVEKITLEISKIFILSMLANYENYGVISDKIVDYVTETSKKIAEQMKAGGIDG